MLLIVVGLRNTLFGEPWWSNFYNPMTPTREGLAMFAGLFFMFLGFFLVFWAQNSRTLQEPMAE